MTEKQLIKKSKYLSYVLRHNPQDADITLDDHGWAKVKDILKNLKLSQEDLDFIVDTDEKKRYEYDKTHENIRACQGHSVKVNIDFKELSPPEILYHGTTWNNITNILKEGLLPMSRLYVHLSSDYETAYKVGHRRKGNTIVLKVLAGEMKRKGYTFYCSNNGVWLINKVPPNFLVVEYKN